MLLERIKSSSIYIALRIFSLVGITWIFVTFMPENKMFLLKCHFSMSGGSFIYSMGLVTICICLTLIQMCFSSCALEVFLHYLQHACPPSVHTTLHLPWYPAVIHPPHMTKPARLNCNGWIEAGWDKMEMNFKSRLNFILGLQRNQWVYDLKIFCLNIYKWTTLIEL